MRKKNNPSAVASVFLLVPILLLLATPARTATTRIVVSLVPIVTTPSGGTGHPTMEPGRLLLKSDGASRVKLRGVTGSAGEPVTTDGSMQASCGMSGDEYFVVLSGNFPATGTPWEFNIPVELRNGNGKASADRSSQYWLIPNMAHRAAEFHRLEVYEPPTPENAANCSLVVEAGSIVFDGTPNPCRSGTQLGGMGLAIP